MSLQDSMDPEGGGGLLDPDDPEGGGGLLDPDDPEGGGGLLDPDDPEGGGGLLDPDDPEGGGGLLDPDDPEGGGGLLDPDDPEGGGGLLDPDDPEGGGGLLDPDDPEGGGGLLDPDDPRARVARREQALRAAQRGRSYDRTGGENTGIPAVERRFSGDVIVRLSSLIPPSDKATLLEVAEASQLPGLLTVLERFGSPSSNHAIRTKKAGRPGATVASVASGAKQYEEGPAAGSLDDLERRAASSAFRPRHSLWSYWRVDGRALEAFAANGAEAMPEHGFAYNNAEISIRLVEALNALSEVDLAYREHEASDPFVAPSTEELEDFQLYLEDSVLGLDVRWARDLLQETDEPIALADLEQGWFDGHEDLDLPPLAYGDNRHGVGAYKGDHGTAVVSQLMAGDDNRLGMVGIAAGAADLSLASHYRAGSAAEPATNGHVADAITALIAGDDPKLGVGDVLLLEVQRAGQPTEVDPLDLDAIRLAVASGVIVVEPAGNGRINLNRLRTVDGRSMRRRTVDFVDSGAILVGAARSAVPHNRAWYSNYGSRVDCFAWGDSVVAAGYGNYLGGADGELYTDTFSGTSSAAPMIAGAAVLVQSLYRQTAGAVGAPGAENERWRRLSPGQMRALLSDPRTGMRQGLGVRGRIGVMPSLRAVLRKSLGIAPQVYLRDHVGDSGASIGRKFCSPDIIVTKKVAGKLGETFGESPAFANVDVFDATLASSGKKRICVRSCNRGLLPASAAAAKLYSAPVCTLVTPDRWNDLSASSAGVSVGDVPPGDTFAVSEALEHAGEENRCLVAVVESEGDGEGPVPCHPSSFHWGRYLRAMRRRRNVAVRNVYGVEVAGSKELELSFAINGTSDAPRAFEFEVIRRLPDAVDLELQTQVGLALKFARGRLWNLTRRDVGAGQATLRLPKQPRLPLGVTPLPAAIDFASKLVLRGADAIRPGHSLAIRQLYRGEEVGRITWRFVAGE